MNVTLEPPHQTKWKKETIISTNRANDWAFCKLLSLKHCRTYSHITPEAQLTMKIALTALSATQQLRPRGTLSGASAFHHWTRIIRHTFSFLSQCDNLWDFSFSSHKISAKTGCESLGWNMRFDRYEWKWEQIKKVRVEWKIGEQRVFQERKLEQIYESKSGVRWTVPIIVHCYFSLLPESWADDEVWPSSWVEQRVRAGRPGRCGNGGPRCRWRCGRRKGVRSWACPCPSPPAGGRCCRPTRLPAGDNVWLTHFILQLWSFFITFNLFHT